MSNKHLHKAQQIKDDEYYTTEEMVADLINYISEDLGSVYKRVYCPCDSKESNFYKTLSKRNDITVIATSDDYNSIKNEDLWDWADIIITNPPFSKIMDFYHKIESYNKEFAFIAPKTLLRRTIIADRISKGFMSAIYTPCKYFIRPDGSLKTATAMFLTSKPIKHPPFKSSLPILCPTYKGIKIINSYKHLPTDDTPVLAPITSLLKINPDEWHIGKIIKPFVCGKYLYDRIELTRIIYK